MKTFYMKRSFMLLGAAAIAATASADFVDVTNQYLKEACYLPGWQGVIGAVNGEERVIETKEDGTEVKEVFGVGEVWNGAFRLYQVLRDLPAGDYTLTVDASYRCGYNDYARDNQEGKPELNTAYIFAGDNKQTVKGLFEGRQVAPNDLWAINDAFKNGEYVNTLTFKHDGGDLTIGIANTGCYNDEWCAFDNFKLVGPDGEVTIENGDFNTGINSKRAWNNVNADGGEKTPDMQKDGSGGGDYRKCGGSPYKYGQQVELPAGKYRFGMLCFHRYGSEMDAAGNYYNHKWPCDIRPEGAYGDAGRTPKDWFEANDYDAQTDYPHAYIFMSKNADCPKDLNFSEDFGDLTEGADVRTRVKDVWEIHNGDLAAMPHNNPVRVEGNPYNEETKEWADIIPYETPNKVIYRNDSGVEREAAAAFANDPEKYYHYVEFELTEPTKVWLGMGKNANSGDGYWHAWADQTLKMFVDSDPNAVEAINAAAGVVEYYNLQGVRVANPQGGVFIVREGNKVSKKVIR